MKLTAFEIHSALRSRKGFECAGSGNGDRQSASPNSVLFHLNHPIQFISVCGVIVSIECDFEKFWLLTLDDSSGATLDLFCPKPQPDSAGTATSVTHRGHGNDSGSRGSKQHHGGAATTPLASAWNAPASLIPQLGIGAVVTAKGTISTFRSVRQLHLERLAVHASPTAAELAFWSARCDLFESTLSKPWVLDQPTRDRLRAEAEAGTRKGQVRDRWTRRKEERRERRERRHMENVKRMYELEDVEREKGAEWARQQGERLERARTRGQL